jgi:DNA-binding MarR family transcriptional regulator
MPTATRSLSKADFDTLSEFRYQMRRFERFSERAALNAGITPQQYLVLLHIKGFRGRSWALVGELAERLQLQPHGAVALVTRCEALELVQRRAHAGDRRQVEVHLQPAGEKMLQTLAVMHRAELQALQGRFSVPNVNFPDPS